MNRTFVIFYYEDRELLRYSLFGEEDGEREETINLLAYENDIPAEEICWTVR